MGHSRMRAALIYQHATRERDRKIADGLSAQIANARRNRSGRVRGPAGAAGSHTRSRTSDAPSACAQCAQQ
jgi:hypothetical protein